jgi:uracil-DNA glycosylase family 4
MLDKWNDAIVRCEACPRLRAWCAEVAATKRRAFQHEEYWGRPVPHFGDPAATGLVLGLAPAAHGANRTGRMFTGDRSGDFLFRALHESGIASQPESQCRGDGLELRGVLVTAVCHCAPPANKPDGSEIEACRRHLRPLLDSRPWRAIVCLGGIAWSQALRHYGIRPVPKFAFMQQARSGPTEILASFHPSQQNTFTGRLTPAMMRTVTDWLAARVG